MIPQTDDYMGLINNDFEYITPTSKTYKLHTDDLHIQSTRIDGIEAVRQAIYLLLSTERYEYCIYDEYGVELWDLYGREDAYVIPELERRITEAVLNDDRVISVDNFKIENKGRIKLCTFNVQSIFGEIDINKEVSM